MTLPRQEAGAHGSAGFTLVELLVALLLFALISLAGVGLVETVIRVQERTEGRGERLAELQRARFLLAADLEQIIAGPVMEGNRFTFLRGSAAGQYRVGYRFAGGTLYREAGSLAAPMLSGVSQFRLRYLKADGWTSQLVSEDDPSRPRAVELDFALQAAEGQPTGRLRQIVELPQEAS